MEILGEIIPLGYALFYGVCGVLLIYLIIRRIRNRKKEDFEDRDN